MQGNVHITCTSEAQLLNYASNEKLLYGFKGDKMVAY